METRPSSEGEARVPRRRRSTSPASLAKAFWKFSCGEETNVHIEADVVGGRVGRSDGLDGVGLRGQRCDIQIGAGSEARDEHVAVRAAG